MLGSLSTDISKTVGGALTEEVNRMLDLFATNSDSIEKNFTTLHQRIDDLEHNVIVVINNDKKIAIDALNKEIKSLKE